MTDHQKREVIREWMNNEFRDACNNDRKRLTESFYLLKVGHDNGDTPEQCVATAIASFVQGIILGETPITVNIQHN